MDASDSPKDAQEQSGPDFDRALGLSQKEMERFALTIPERHATTVKKRHSAV
jgi:hypothetical protein